MRKAKLRHWVALVVLILSGEAIFFLPFVLARVFRPTFLAVFGVTNTQLGLVFSVYGTVAVGAYFFGGPLADRFPTRKLIAAALFTTGLGGIYMATFPEFQQLQWLFGFWGLTTILLFWAAMIRATREWGGQSAQGKAFGLLDGGRGIVAAVLSTILVAVFAAYLPADPDQASLAERTLAFQKVIYTSLTYVFVVAVLVLVFLKPIRPVSQEESSGLKLRAIGQILKMSTVWIQAVIIVCAYVGYKVSDDLTLYAREVMGYDEVKAAGIGTLSFYVRPLVAILAGVIADRVCASRMIVFRFGLVALGAGGLGALDMHPGTSGLFVLLVVTTSTGIFALRGLYFAITQEARVPLALTGTAVGLMSIIGYTPDIFMGPLMGYLLDRSPGPVGHAHVFLLLAGFSVVGMLAAVAFRVVIGRLPQKEPGGENFI